MAIDNCPYAFEELAEEILPAYFEELQKSISAPHEMATFGQKGMGKTTILKRLNRSSDFPGCYVLLEESKPIYVGISRSIVQRLLQHVKGTYHYDASLAYRIASQIVQHGNQRNVAMTDPDFKNEFEKAKNYIKSLKVAFIQIHNYLEIYMFEAYCAIKLDTAQWNTFKTH
ncbi:hypothetical protein [Desulfohalobium retbaense]|nr:hypothetical protein [Desulfohalobium retbaense]